MLTKYLVFAQSMPGLAPALEMEAQNSGFSDYIVNSMEDGLELRLDRNQLWAYSMSTRLAEGIWLRVGRFLAQDFDELKQQLKKLPMRAFIKKGSSFRLKVHAKKSKLWHSGAIAERMIEVLEQGAGLRHAPEDEAAFEILFRIVRDRAEVSVSASGGRLHKRGFRTWAEKASLRETLAFAVVQPLLKPGLTHFYDAFCGAGTLGLEASLWAQGILPGQKRVFDFERFAFHSAAEYEEQKQVAMSEARRDAPAPELQIIASDISAKALRSTQENFKNAELASHVTLLEKSAIECLDALPEGTVVAANPPYGKRLPSGSVVKELLTKYDGNRGLGAFSLVLGGPAKGQLPRSWVPHLQVRNGGLQVGVYLKRIAVGSAKATASEKT